MHKLIIYLNMMNFLLLIVIVLMELIYYYKIQKIQYI